MPARCFLALTLPDPLIGSLGRARSAVLAGDPAWAGEKWVAPSSLHVTVAFLGALADEDSDAAIARLRSAAATVPSFELRPSGIVAVPSARRATMLWATLADPGCSLTALRDALVSALPGVRCEDVRPLRPHVTLARARSHRPVAPCGLAAATRIVQDFGKEPDGVMSVRSVTLFSSTLRPAGPDYREMALLDLAR